MLPELALDEYAGVLDDLVVELLAACEVRRPPVDALRLAQRLGITVAYDAQQPQRARYLRLADGDAQAAQPSILIRPDERPERRQWAIAHEIGEHVAHEVFARLGADPSSAPLDAREQVANALAGRLLVPTVWFKEFGRSVGWDLPLLKERFMTASHELLARRMLDGAEPLVVSLFDQGRLTWRRATGGGRVPPLTAIERQCWGFAHDKARSRTARSGALRVQAWPVHEPGWKREVVRAEVDPWCDDDPGE